MSILTRLLRRQDGSGAPVPDVPPVPPASAHALPDLSALLPRQDLDDVLLARTLLAGLAGRPGVRLAHFLSSGGAWPRRDRFSDADPLPEDQEAALLRLARDAVDGARTWEPRELEHAHAGLQAQCRRRSITRLHLQPLPAEAPWPAWILLGLNGGETSACDALEAVARELARLLWLADARCSLSKERRLVQGEQSRLMVQGFELDRVRQVAEREVELARRRVDEAERAKNEFLSSVSHELRTPLNAIQGYTRMVLRESNLTDRQRLSLERVMTSSQNQLRLINNILDYSRLEAGRMRLELEELSLLQVLRDVVTQVEPLASEQGLRLELHLPEDLAELRAICDRAKLEQVLINLIGNAIKFTQKGVIVLRLRVAAGILHLDVQDTGIGIPRDELDQIFERFRRSRLTEGARSASGTGLGLAISRRLSELLGGSINLESEPGQGSTFTLSLPHFLDLETARLALAQPEEET